MKYRYCFLSVLLILLIFSSCEFDPCLTKQRFLKNHKNFVEEVLKDGTDYSEKEWDEKDKKFDQLITECYDKFKDKLNKSEKREFFKTSSKYYLKKSKEELSIELKDLKNELKRFFDEDFSESVSDIKEDFNEIFDEDFKNDLKEIFDEEFKEDLKDAMDEIKIGIEELGKELKEIFRDSNTREI